MWLIWGLPPAAAAPLQGSQVCSALQRCALRSGLRPPLQAARPAAASPPVGRQKEPAQTKRRN
ncbi:hypothetical protein SGRA_0720 [Saprospira grandis str. Lewin]|uniref:Uncharacterized protein n=1 Tax=Saprospira grandis (strain Lewin) TaxID=984262 RepID=H6L1B8_SAPGL|nr:hypothetical protein SGRA_0720 [Saprospira grandis str. Lewin]